MSRHPAAVCLADTIDHVHDLPHLVQVIQQYPPQRPSLPGGIGLKRECDGPPPLLPSSSSSPHRNAPVESDRVVLPTPEGKPGMDQDYCSPDDNRTAGGIGGIGVGSEDVHVDRAPHGGWDGMGGDLRLFHREGGIDGISYGQTQKVAEPIDCLFASP